MRSHARGSLFVVTMTLLNSACVTTPPSQDAASDVVAREVDTGEVDAGTPADTVMLDVVSDVALDTTVATDANPIDTSVVSDGGIGSIVSRTMFEQMFLHRGTSPCVGAFYTYEAFLSAAATFPAFANEGTRDDRLREVAAFLANAAHETTGGWDTAPDGRFSWGLCWITEGGLTPPVADYCVNSAPWPCAQGQKYYGRGPLQLSYNYNYGQAGAALGLPLLSDPGLVARDPVVAFRTALWFWMTPQAPKPSCHAVMTSQWTPSAQDTQAGRLPGFGLTVNIINGGVECNQPTPPQVTDRIGFYQRFTQLLGTTTGSNLDCASMRSY